MFWAKSAWTITGTCRLKIEQKALFKAQLDIAAETGLPVSIHMRDAAKDSLDILKAHARTPIIFHCYSGSTETMREALKLDSMISFGGTHHL